MRLKKILAGVISLALISTSLISIGAFAENVEYQNLISNSTFDTSTADWYKYTASGGNATISNEDGKLALNVEEVGTLNYGVQLYYDIIPLYENAEYRLHFDISSDVDRFLECMLQQNGGTYTAYTWKGIDLIADETQTIDITFTMEYETDFFSRLVFNCGEQKGDGDNSPHTIYLDNVYLELIDDSNVDYSQFEEPEQTILTNQVGYLNDVNKIAIFRNDTPIQDTSFNVVNSDTDEIVYTGEIYGENFSSLGDELYYYGDFSNVITDGTYYIETETLGQSYPFEISSNVYDNLLNSTLRMFYLQRCGTEIIDDNANHPECHTSMATIYGTDTKIDVSGGWHDAGDYGRYVVAGAKAVADLLLAYDTNPDIFTDNVGIPESGNGIADILDEVRYELEWLLKMQDLSTGGVYHKVTCQDFPAYVMPQYETDELIVTPISTTATADFCAVMSMAYEYYYDIDKDFAEICLERAKLAYQFLEENPNLIFENPKDITTGEYGDTSDKDERYWATAQLFKATNDEKYLIDFENLVNKSVSTGMDWSTVGFYGNIAYITSDSDKKNPEMVDKVSKSIDLNTNNIVNSASSNPYNISLSKFNWGSNMTIANTGNELYFASTLDNQNFDNLTKYANEQLNYLLGRNAVGTCFITGFGTSSPENPHHRPSMKCDHAIEGMLVGGVNQNLEDSPAKALLSSKAPAKRWIDNSESYSTNEITIYWNSPLIYLLANATKKIENPNDSTLLGDCNEDENINYVDLLNIKKYVLGITSNISNNADINQDSNINILDVIALKNLLLTDF